MKTFFLTRHIILLSGQKLTRTSTDCFFPKNNKGIFYVSLKLKIFRDFRKPSRIIILIINKNKVAADRSTRIHNFSSMPEGHALNGYSLYLSNGSPSGLEGRKIFLVDCLSLLWKYLSMDRMLISVTIDHRCT